MISKEEEFLKKYKYLNEKITDEKVIQNQKVYRSHLKEIKSLIPIIDAIQKKKI